VLRLFGYVPLLLSLLFSPAFLLSLPDTQRDMAQSRPIAHSAGMPGGTTKLRIRSLVPGFERTARQALPAPQPRAAGGTAGDLVVEWDHACATTTTGGAQCWGANESGQLGDGSNMDRWTPVEVVGLDAGVKAIAEGRFHTCALMAGGGVNCWGANQSGQLGDGTNADRWTPVNVRSLGSGAVAIVAGLSHTCALMDGGAVRCWGANDAGELGDGTNIDSWTPVAVSGLSAGVTDLIAGLNDTCALTSSGGVKCWGANARGQLGDGTNTDRWTPVDVRGLDGGVEAVVGRSFHKCALLANGGVKCWGANESGQLGDGTGADRWTPVDVQGLGSGVKTLAPGISHTCALMSDGGVRCWGANEMGQLGDGTNTNRWTPVNVRGLSEGVAGVAWGFFHTCALLTGGGVNCWGDNEYGQLGDGTNTDRWTPVAVQGLSSGVAAVYEGPYYTCALVDAGGVKCWGANDAGQLGDGTNTDRWAPGNAFVSLLP
jgi:alpha-tubulin suppressor-like RCC1 family protein